MDESKPVQPAVISVPNPATGFCARYYDVEAMDSYLHEKRAERDATLASTVIAKRQLLAALTELAAMTAERDNWCAIAGRLEIERDEERAAMSNRNSMLHGKFGYVPDPSTTERKCACAYCMRDVEALADHAAEMECELHLPGGYKSRAETAEAQLARLREAATKLCFAYGDGRVVFGLQERVTALRAALANATDEVKG